jgi:uncharacterized membrane protein
MKRTVLTALLFMALLPAYAQVILKNSGYSKLYVAYCYGNLLTGWTSAGWAAVEPGEAKNLCAIGIFTPPTFYYCARIAGCDQGYYGDRQFPVDPANTFTIRHADQVQNLPTAGFRQVNLGTQKTFTIELAPLNITCMGQAQGKWRVPLDKEGDYAEKAEDAFYTRELTFENGRPLGWCRDFYPDGTLRAEFKLSQFKPAVYEGHCTWYNKDGSKEKEVNYRDGNPVSAYASYEVVALPVQHFFVNSTTKLNGHSMVPYYLALPPNTVKWFYEFTASRDKAETERYASLFSAAAKLGALADRTGLLSYSVNLLTAPPGSDYCTVYVAESDDIRALMNGQHGFYSETASRLNFRSGVVEVNEALRMPAILFSNPSAWYGVNVAVRVVAVVGKSY